MKTVYIYVNGILTHGLRAMLAGSPGWNDDAAAWTDRHTDAKGHAFDYYSDAVLRWVWESDRTENLADVIYEYAEAGFRVVLVGHSNGCDLIVRAIPLAGVRVEEVHLVSGACEADFDANGLNAALRSDLVGKVACYVAGRDRAMVLARWSTVLLSWIGLGYGTLGRKGPKRVNKSVTDRVEIIRRPEYGHSTWWDRNWFGCTLRLITKAA